MADTRIGIFGGSGFYALLDDVEDIKMDTPYGPPSDSLSLATYQGKKIAFLPRHGRHHTIPPHAINYRANLWAFKELGVKFVISPTAAGSLRQDIEPGSFVVADQFIDRTKGRKDTFYDGPVTTHISCADPYCDYLRSLAIDAVKKVGVTCHETGTVAVIQGPRFSTRAESSWLMQIADVINMTQYPEVVLARELEMSFVNISLITDYDAGLLGAVERVSVPDMIRIFKTNIEKVQESIFEMISRIDVDQDCESHHALSFARFND